MYATSIFDPKKVKDDVRYGMTEVDTFDLQDEWKIFRNYGGLYHLLPKFEHIFVAVITFSHFLLCRYCYYQLVAYCVCFKMICEMSL